MKVLHLSSERTWRGGEQQIAYLLEESRNQGIDCHVIPRIGSAFEKYCIEQKFLFQSAGYKSQFDFATALKIKSYCATNQIDLIHVHSSHSHAQAIWSTVLGNKTPIILSRRVDFPLKSNWLSRFKYSHKSIRRIICVSNAIEAIVRKNISRPEICTTIHSGIDIHKSQGNSRSEVLRKELGIQPNETLVGNISAIADHKDYFTFVDTAEIILKQDQTFKFVIVGDGPLFENIKNYIKSKSLENSILMTGFRTDIQSIFKDLDIFLMTSKTEGLGTTVLDAFANDIPVVSTNAGGIPEMITHEKTGLLAQVGDSNSLSRLVLRLKSDHELQSILAKNASEKLLSFSKEQTAKETIAEYHAVLTERSTQTF